MAAPNLNAVASALLKQVQVAENFFKSVLVSRLLGFAQGVQLDVLGRVVGEDRLGREDEAFRKGIRLRIFINGSSGRPEDVIYVARQLTGFDLVRHVDVTPGNYRIIIPGWPGDDGSLFRTLQAMTKAGERLLGVTSSGLVPLRFNEHFNLRFLHEAT